MVSIPESMQRVRARSRDYGLAAWYREASQELVLFLHGLGCSKENWQHAWSRREFRDKSLLAIDLPGFGHSPRPSHFGYSLEEHAAVLSALVDAHALKRIHLVAHSMGGTIALLMSARTLSRLASLVLVEPRLVQSSCGIAAEASKFTADEFLTGEFDRMRRRIRFDRRMAYDLDRSDELAFYYSANSLMQWTNGRTMLDKFETAPCTKVFIYGAEDRFLEEIGEIADEFTIGISGAGHFVMCDNPDEFYTRVAAIMEAAD